jgi:hypothetical protein
MSEQVHDGADRIHGGYLVPVRVDPLTGERSVLCFLDAEEWGWAPDFWASYCSTCRSIVSDPIPGTEGLESVDGAPDDIADPLYRAEARLSQEHAAAMADQDPEWAEHLSKTAGRVW